MEVDCLARVKHKSLSSRHIMSQKLKRKLSTDTRSVSPPKIKRKLSAGEDVSIVSKEISQSSVLIFSWNVNGVLPLLQKKLTFQKDSVSPLRTFLKRHRWPQFLCLQEVKISPTDLATQKQLQQAANSGGGSTEPSYTATFSLPRDKYNATGFGRRVHGVATLIRKDLCENLKSTWLPDWDLEGRVLVHEVEFHGRTIVVVNGYWVNGTSNPYRNTETGEVEGTRHDHKLRFHTNMLKLAQSLEQQGKSVVLIGDMNVARSTIDGHPNLRTSPVQHVTNRADFNSKFFTHEDGLCGVDVFRQVHGDLTKYTYHPRGGDWGQSCDRVDNIIVTRKLGESSAIIDTDICDNTLDRGHSDHVPLWVEIDISQLPSS